MADRLGQPDRGTARPIARIGLHQGGFAGLAVGSGLARTGRGLTSKCLSPPSRPSRAALVQTDARDRPSRAAIWLAEAIGLDGGDKHFEVNPRPVRARPEPTARPAKPPPPTPPVDVPVMRPCSLLELEADRCKWPLGNLVKVATLFCGGDSEKGQQYCPYHQRIAHGDITPPAVRA